MKKNQTNYVVVFQHNNELGYIQTKNPSLIADRVKVSWVPIELERFNQFMAKNNAINAWKEPDSWNDSENKA